MTRRAASKALGEIGDRNTFEALREVAEDDPDTATRGWALLSLGRIDVDQARPVLMEALSDEAWVIRRDAAFAFGETGGPKDISSLRAASRREPWYRRRVYRQAIAKLGR